ncbi:hypothetical protein [Paraflavitalea speifideaquila]|uniref:hypothetical protein n=1 Tax=Paraflavitalea speifideaquila TaxID=3076558 RepID=UPI0028E9D417|nr:hypothetical protein [Paraflavitalea speifideiaquila]
MAKRTKSSPIKRGIQAPPQKSTKSTQVKPYSTEAPPAHMLNEDAVAYGNSRQKLPVVLTQDVSSGSLGKPILSDATQKPESQMTP